MIRNVADTQDTLSFVSRMIQDKEETMSDTSWIAVTKGKGKEVWRLEPEGEGRRRKSGPHGELFFFFLRRSL